MKDDFFTRKTCRRCGGSLDGGRIMSMLNTDCICMKCYEKEQKHPRIKEARDAEFIAVRKGNMNFRGILNSNGE